MSPALSLRSPSPGRSTVQDPRVTMWNCAHPLPLGAWGASQLPPNLQKSSIMGRILSSGTIAFSSSAAPDSDIRHSLDPRGYRVAPSGHPPERQTGPDRVRETTLEVTMA